MFTALLSRLVGAQRFMETNNPDEHIFGRFATQWQDKLICCLNDFNTSETRGCNREKFKEIITNNSCMKEKKGHDVIQTQNYTIFITTNNSDNPVHKTQESRRYLIIETSDELKGNVAYFRGLDEYMRCDANIKAIYNTLKAMDLTDYNICALPHTEVGELIAQENASPAASFLSTNKDTIKEIICYKKQTASGFAICKEGDEGALPCIPHKVLFNRFCSWGLRAEVGLDMTRWNSRKLQSEIYRVRSQYKLDYKPNKCNSSLSVWLVKDIDMWAAQMPDDSSATDSEDSDADV
jgi:hypothetical protein